MERSTNREYWKAWLATRDEDADIGMRVSRRVAKLVRERIEAVAKENKRLAKRIGELEEVEDLLKSMNIRTGYFAATEIKNRIRNAEAALPEGFKSTLLSIRSGSEQALRKIEEIEAASKQIRTP